MTKKRNKNVIVLGVILLACLLLVINIVSKQIGIQQKYAEIAQYEQMMEDQTDINDELKDVISSGDIGEYAAGIARDKLGYGESDEKVYINITGK